MSHCLNFLFNHSGPMSVYVCVCASSIECGSIAQQTIHIYFLILSKHADLSRYTFIYTVRTYVIHVQTVHIVVIGCCAARAFGQHNIFVVVDFFIFVCPPPRRRRHYSAHLLVRLLAQSLCILAARPIQSIAYCTLTINI